MSWLEKLYQTYENNAGRVGDKSDKIPLYPICHTAQNVHIEIRIDGEGNFKGASVISDKSDSPTIIPCTEASATRAGTRPKNHPLCDKLQYLAGDFIAFGGEVTVGFKGNPSEPFEALKADLEAWCSSEYSHPKAEAVLKYIRQGKVIADLVENKILHGKMQADGSCKLLYEWTDDDTLKPKIFNVLNGKIQKNGKRNPWQAEAFVRWAIEIPGVLDVSMADKSLQEAWISYSESGIKEKGLCFVTGERRFLAGSHPSKLRNPGDKAKLVSSNDSSGFTYRGKFTDETQVAAVGFSVTQKAHSALRWLLDRQGRVFYVKSKGQAKPSLSIVAWAVSGADIPDPLADSDDLLSDTPVEIKAATASSSFTAQEFGTRFSQYISGYSIKLGAADQIVVLGIDSATPGRMAVTYYRELSGSDFLERIGRWHKGCAWHQHFRKEYTDEKGKSKMRPVNFIGAPAPTDIAQAAYGTRDDEQIRLDDNLRRITVARLIPCIIDGAPLPWDIVNSCVRKAVQRQCVSDWAWQKSLGIACGLYRYYFKGKESYTMGLDRDRKTRDYLYGRLLAVADCLEGYALKLSNESDRPTSATKLMQRFAERPCNTWEAIELALVPYKTRLGRNNKYERELGEIHALFADVPGYVSNEPLSGEFLLGFHCQRLELFKSRQNDNDNQKENENESDEQN